MNKVKGLLSVATVAAASAGFAQVSQYDNFRQQFFEQTSTSAPTAAGAFAFTSRVFLQNSTNADSFTLTDPSSNAYASNGTGGSVATSDYYLYYADGSSTSQAAEDAKYPSGTYMYTLNGGSDGYDTNSATLNIHPDDFSTSTPFLTGNSYSNLQGMDSTKSLSVSWNSFVDAAGTAQDITFFSVSDATTGALIYGNSGSGASYTGDTLAANLLQANHSYNYTLFFSARFNGTSGVTDTSNAFFGAATTDAFDLGTNGSFTTAAPVPEPASFAVIGFGLLALKRRRRS